ncbi:MAG: S-layer protein domain-containing protein, partial [Euryarchaeota archaeon]|nr:S-layer protein domain-containing protein [Euryarchaeota archaeon]
EDILTERTFVYQTDVGSEADVPVFSVYVDAIFRGVDANLVQLKCAMLIDDDLVSVIDEGAGILDVRTVTSESVRLESDRDIFLGIDSDFHIAEGLWLRVASDLDGNGVQNCRYYPYVSRECPEPEPTPTPTPTPTPAEEVVDIRGEVVEANGMGQLRAVGSAGEYANTHTWNPYNFAAFYYDQDNDAGSEALILDLTGSDNRSIRERGLVYTTTPLPQTYAIIDDGVVDSLGTVNGSPVTRYFIEGWMAEKYVAISTGGSTTPHGNKISKMLVEFDSSDKKTLSEGEAWGIGGGFTLTAQQIDLEGNKVWLTLSRDGKELDSEVIDAGDSGGRVYMYTEDLSGVEDVVVFSCYVDAVFRGTDSNIMQLKHVFLIDNDVIEVCAGEIYGDMEVTTASASGITLKNDCKIDISRDGDCNIEIMDDMFFRVAESDTVRFYPCKAYTEAGEYEVRGTVVAANDSSWIYPVGAISNIGTGYTWNSYNFGAFHYDLDNDLLTEQLTIEELHRHGNRTIAKDKLVYSTTPVPQTYAIIDGGVADSPGMVNGNPVTRYFIEGWMGDEYVAISTGGSTTPYGNKLSRLLVEFEGSDKKTLIVGEAWDIGNGFALTASKIDPECVRVWLTLSKDGRNIDNSVIDTSAIGDRRYMYTEDISGVKDVVVFSCYVSAIFKGTDSSVVQLNYVFLIDNDILEIHTGDTYGVMEAAAAGISGITLKNDRSIDLSKNSDAEIMRDLFFRVADNNTVRLYPYAERHVIRETVPPTPTPAPQPTPHPTPTPVEVIPAIDSDRDGVPDAWDEEPDTLAGYRTDSEGRGQRWGDMDGDGKLTSVDA